MINQNNKSLCQKHEVVVVEHLGIERSGSLAEKYLMPKKEMVLIQIHTNNFWHMLTLKVFEECIQILRVSNLPLNWQFNISFNNLKFLEISFCFFVFMILCVHRRFP